MRKRPLLTDQVQVVLLEALLVVLVVLAVEMVLDIEEREQLVVMASVVAVWVQKMAVVEEEVEAL